MTDKESVGAALEELLAKQAIYEAIVRASMGIDRGDLDAIKAAYWPDGWLETGVFNGTVAEYLPMLTRALTVFKSTTHAVSNVLIELNGDKARSQTYFNAYHEFPSSPPIHVVGRYIDNLERRGGEWRIARRLLVMDWHYGAESEDQFPVSASKRIRGQRKPADPWYK